MGQSLVVVIVNSGFADDVMDAARKAKAFGGTVISGRGTAKEEAEKLFNITISPEKDVVLIIADDEIKDDILHNVYRHVGLDSPGQGIAFTLPVDEAVGIQSKIN